MSTIAVSADYQEGRILTLGRQYENNATTLKFDCSALTETYGSGSASIYALRHGETTPYLVTGVSMESDGTTVDWVVSSYDTAIVGKGFAELRWVPDDDSTVSARPILFWTKVLQGVGESDAAGEDVTSWLDTLADTLNDSVYAQVEALIKGMLEDGTLAALEVATDTTLTKSGYPADAAAVGDELDIFSTKEVETSTETYANPDVENLLDGVEYTANLIVNSSGVETASSNYRMTSLIPVTYGQYVTFLTSNTGSAYDAVGMWAFYDSDGTFSKRVSEYDGNLTTRQVNNSSWTYMRFMIGINADLDSMWITVGDTADESLENYNNYWLTRSVTKTIDRSVFGLVDQCVTLAKLADDVLEYMASLVSGSSSSSSSATYAEGKGIYINPAIPGGWCRSQLEESDYTLSSSPSTLPIATYIAMLDTLASTYADYVTVTTLGTDASGTYSLKAYTLTPGTDRAYMTDSLPTIIITGAIHGEERAGSFAVYCLLKDLCTQYAQHPILSYLRKNVQFILIPVANPYGFSLGQRYNYNGVNLNRNFDASWDSSVDYSGDSAGSEVETQLIQALIDDNPDALALFDIHSNNDATKYSDNMYTNWMSLARTPVYDGLEMTAINQVQGLTMRMQELGYADGEDCAYTSHTTPAGMMKDYALATGIWSLTCEGSIQILSDSSSYAAATQKNNAEILENLIVNVLRCAAGTGGAVWEPES